MRSMAMQPLPSLASLVFLALPAARPAQQGEDPQGSRLVEREQDDLAARTKRLREMMERVQVRYEKEGRTQLSNLLKDGLDQLRKSALVDEMMSAARDLRAK